MGDGLRWQHLALIAALLLLEHEEDQDDAADQDGHTNTNTDANAQLHLPAVVLIRCAALAAWQGSLVGAEGGKEVVSSSAAGLNGQASNGLVIVVKVDLSVECTVDVDAVGVGTKADNVGASSGLNGGTIRVAAVPVQRQHVHVTRAGGALAVEGAGLDGGDVAEGADGEDLALRGSQADHGGCISITSHLSNPAGAGAQGAALVLGNEGVLEIVDGGADLDAGGREGGGGAGLGGEVVSAAAQVELGGGGGSGLVVTGRGPEATQVDSGGVLSASSCLPVAVGAHVGGDGGGQVGADLEHVAVGDGAVLVNTEHEAASNVVRGGNADSGQEWVLIGLDHGAGAVAVDDVGGLSKLLLGAKEQAAGDGAGEVHSVVVAAGNDAGGGPVAADLSPDWLHGDQVTSAEVDGHQEVAVAGSDGGQPGVGSDGAGKGDAVANVVPVNGGGLNVGVLGQQAGGGLDAAVLNLAKADITSVLEQGVEAVLGGGVADVGQGAGSILELVHVVS
mmetsp:Transcript_20373/g.44533  ORF Transcript_20373/g.44533 Transcript_20373/m.44533 type:complete len:506 (+) Transcript_20373:1066-2583(+)